MKDIDKALEELSSGSLSQDPLYKFSMTFISPAGKGKIALKAADIVTDFFKHQRIQSLLKSNSAGDIAEAKQLIQSLKIKNPSEAEKMYVELQGKGKKLAKPEDIQKAIEEFLKK